MGIAARCQAKVPFVVRRVASLLQGAKHQIRQNPFLWLPRDLFHQLLVVLWRDFDIHRLQRQVAMRRDALLSSSTPGSIFQARQVRNATLGKATTQAVAEAERNFVELEYLHWIRSLMNTVQRRDFAS